MTNGARHVGGAGSLVLRQVVFMLLAVCPAHHIACRHCKAYTKRPSPDARFVHYDDPARQGMAPCRDVFPDSEN